MRKIPLITVFGLSIILTSCGSYQYAAQDNDGIYGSDATTVEYEDAVAETTGNSNNDTFYKNYFKEKSLEYQIPEEDEVFTDIDSYEGNYVENDSTQTEYASGYAGWGQDTDDVTINVYNSGFNNFGWYNPYRVGFGWGYSPYWTIGWGHYGYYSPYYYGGFYGGYYPYHWYGYASPYYNYGYYGGYPYNRRSIAYHSGRRGNLYARGSSPRRDLSTRTIRRSSISRDTPTRVRTRGNTPTRIRSNSSDSPRVRTRTTTPRTRTNTNTPRVRTRTTTPRTRTNTPRVRTRTTTPRRSSTINSSPSRTRSSGSVGGSRRGGRR